MNRFFLIILTLFLQLASAFAHDMPVADEVAIRQQRAASNKGIAERDTESFLDTLMPDYHVVTSANLQLSGHDAQRQMIEQVFSKYPDASYVRTPVKIEVNSAIGAAAETGTWVGTWTNAGRQVEMHGSYFAKWRKIEQRWLLQAEIFVALQ